jgi:hypothetical protein
VAQRHVVYYRIRDERKDHTLQPTELVDQIYFWLVAAKNQDWQSRLRFLATAARIMRLYLIDHGRGRLQADFVALERVEKFLPADSVKIVLGVKLRSMQGLWQGVRQWLFEQSGFGHGS